MRLEETGEGCDRIRDDMCDRRSASGERVKAGRQREVMGVEARGIREGWSRS